ncbi:MAG: hypothetical protein LBS31_05180, partial [Candidatus Adiutrix sp.]|nr:hypothetical protein [Candidatus Adiutrix sp.]
IVVRDIREMRLTTLIPPRPYDIASFAKYKRFWRSSNNGILRWIRSSNNAPTSQNLMEAFYLFCSCCSTYY